MRRISVRARLPACPVRSFERTRVRVHESKHVRVCFVVSVRARARVSPVRQSCRSVFTQVALIAVPPANCEGSSCSFTL